MPETADPIEALNAKDLASRAAAARDLAQSGSLEQLPRLVQMCIKDSSQGVRLHCAGAVADILSRHRAPDALGQAEREALWAPIVGVDPGFNVALFQVAAEIGTAAALQRILGGLRDPRVDVRMGACVGLLRYAAQGQYNGNRELEASIVATLGDNRIKPDTRLETVRICCNLGYQTVLEAAEKLATQLNPRQAEQLEELLAQLRAPIGPEGVWVEAGKDAGALVPRARRGAAAACWKGRMWTEGGWQPEAPVRRMVLKEVGEESAGPVLQVGNRSWVPAEAEEVVELADRVVAAQDPQLRNELLPLWPDSAAGRRARGSMALADGKVDEAIALFTEALDLKKVPVDCSYWLAEALRRAGRAAEARPHLERFVAKAPKKSPVLADARKRLEEGAA